MTNDDQQSAPPAGPAAPARVVADPDIMGGWPCFAGTRVPASMVVAMVDDGTPWSELVGSYPFLTEAHVAAARAYLAAPENQGKGPTNWLGLPATGASKVVRPDSARVRRTNARTLSAIADAKAGKTTPVAPDEL